MIRTHFHRQILPYTGKTVKTRTLGGKRSYSHFTSGPTFSQVGPVFDPLPNFTEKPFLSLPHLGFLNRAIVQPWDATMAPFFFFGKHGIGKTHLLAEIMRNIVAQNPGTRFAYFSGDSFLRIFTAARTTERLQTLIDALRQCDVFLIDDVTELQIPQHPAEEEVRFFEDLHIFLHDRINDFRHSQKLMFFSSTDHPSHFRGHTRITSRFLSGFAHEIPQPGRADLKMALEAKAMARGLAVAEERLLWIVERLKPDLREVESVVNLLEAEHKDPAMNNLLESYFVSRPIQRYRDVTLEDVATWVSKYTGVEVESILSKKREHRIAFARHLTTFLAVKLLRKPRKDVSAVLKNDHSTVIYALKIIEKGLTDANSFVSNLVDLFKKEWDLPG